jgi:hypothetical protein
MGGSIPSFEWTKVEKNVSVKAAGPISECDVEWMQQIQIQYKSTQMFCGGRAIAEAVSRWLPIAEARVGARVWQVGFVVDKVVSGQVFSEYFVFPCQNHSLHNSKL